MRKTVILSVALFYGPIFWKIKIKLKEYSVIFADTIFTVQAVQMPLKFEA
jgi:hypothetical protein